MSSSVDSLFLVRLFANAHEGFKGILTEFLRGLEKLLADANKLRSPCRSHQKKAGISETKEV